jgi:hypothetical protein
MGLGIEPCRDEIKRRDGQSARKVGEADILRLSPREAAMTDANKRRGDYSKRRASPYLTPHEDW